MSCPAASGRDLLKRLRVAAVLDRQSDEGHPKRVDVDAAVAFHSPDPRELKDLVEGPQEVARVGRPGRVSARHEDAIFSKSPFLVLPVTRVRNSTSLRNLTISSNIRSSNGISRALWLFAVDSLFRHRVVVEVLELHIGQLIPPNARRHEAAPRRLRVRRTLREQLLNLLQRQGSPLFCFRATPFRGFEPLRLGFMPHASVVDKAPTSMFTVRGEEV